MNTLGTAPGMWMERNNKVFVSLPGVPFEMEGLIDREVLPRVRDKFDCPYILHRTLLIFGLGESTLAARIEDWEDALPPEIKLAYLPSLGNMRLRLSSKGFDKSKVISEVQKQIDTLIPLIKEEFVGFEEDDASIEAIIGKQLTKIGKTVATAESCTGGKIAERFTANSGASAYFKGSVVSYATESKINILGVSKEAIDTDSVVSAKVAESMAKQVLELFDTDFAIATTGNAGPTKGDSDVEVGTVFIAIATKTGVYSEKFMLGDLRLKVINKGGANKAFEMLLKEIFKN
ncbi:molybdopterin binding motif CinA N-terminal domain / C-terminal domain [Algibacter lectus]|uniref:Molybdopterin binding motif CinA N-terminal domain / C-terminal domain n=1 Tax=Algibacter lectus TaxID=221126 RepID=A0A090X181_9FLAO|nr:molybdopterin binding motif CinA N-terminal domain / C-terminal domain [Algibacter lectus]